MPKLHAVAVSSYRSFAEETELELRPLTLLYGRNSAGKSALLRVLPLLGDSLSEGATAPFDLSGEAGRDSVFLDLVWKGRPIEDAADADLHIACLFGSEGTKLSRVDYGLNFSRERRVTLIKSLEVSSRKGVEFRAVFSPEADERRAKALHYDVRVGKAAERRLAIQFTGLIPEPVARSPWIDEVRRRMLELRGAIQWLGAVRSPPERLNPELGSRPIRMSSSGKEACSILRSDPAIRDEVAAFYQDRLGRTLLIEEVPPRHYRVLLRPNRAPAMDIDLVDAGEGLSQLLPVLVAAALGRRHAAFGPSVVAVEEPESHLHPDAQRMLAEHLCALAASPDPPALVLETHSYPLLLSIQLEIARGRLPPDRVLAHWVHQRDDHVSRAERVTFDHRGAPEGNWPPDVFADQRELARELLREQMKGSARG